MIKLTSAKMEELVKEKSGKSVMYLGIFVSEGNLLEKPIKHAFLYLDENPVKILSVLETSILKLLK